MPSIVIRFAKRRWPPAVTCASVPVESVTTTPGTTANIDCTVRPLESGSASSA